MAHSSRYHIPPALLQPLWLRSRESLANDRLIYDPVGVPGNARSQKSPV